MLQPVVIRVPSGLLPRGPQRRALQQDYARRALAQCARLTGAPLSGWTKDDRNVPLPNNGYHWSISHKPGFAAAVVADAPIGIDIEQIVSRRRHLWDDVATDAEWTLVGPRNWEGFYRIWTAKEAVLKRLGIGVRGLDHCRVVERPSSSRFTLGMDEGRFSVSMLANERFVVAVCSDVDVVEWHQPIDDCTPEGLLPA